MSVTDDERPYDLEEDKPNTLRKRNLGGDIVEETPEK